MGDIASPRLFWALIVLSALAFVGILYLTSYLNFFWDEWGFVSYDRGWNLRLFLMPNNEHWSAVPLIVWKLLFIVVGLRSHIPYEAALLAFHVAAVLLLFTLIRRRSGDLPAFGAALILLVLGSGGTDIVWAFQIGFVGSVAFGLLAMVLLDGNPPFPSRILPASAALLFSLMSSGVGVAFLAALAVELAFDRQRRRFLLAIVAPAAAFGEWFLAFGAALSGSPGAPCPSCAPAAISTDIYKGPLNLDYILSLANFAKFGVQASISGVFGLPGTGVFLAVPILALVALHWFGQRGVASWQIGFTFGLLFWFALTALGRAQYGSAEAGAYRYVYVGVVFLLPLVADAAQDLPWRSIWRPAFTAIFAVALAGNALQLRERALVDPLADLIVPATQLMQIEDAELQTVEFFRGAPDMSLDRSLDDRVMPQLNAGPYFVAIDELGSPVAPATMDTLRRLPARTVDQVMLNLFGNALTLGPDSGQSESGLPCRMFDATSGSMIDLLVPGGQSLMLRSSAAGDAYLYLSFLGDPTADPQIRAQLQPGTHEWLHIPKDGSGADEAFHQKSLPLQLALGVGHRQRRLRQPGNS